MDIKDSLIEKITAKYFICDKNSGSYEIGLMKATEILIPDLFEKIVNRITNCASDLDLDLPKNEMEMMEFLESSHPEKYDEMCGIVADEIADLTQSELETLLG